jgi:Arc/MetJ-type ribon-helix-helix transcriptional regulator
MTITLTPNQEKSIRRAIDAGLVRSVDDFIASAIEALPHQPQAFDHEKGQAAVARIRDLRKGVRLDLQGMSLREFAHIGHRF